MRPWIGCVFVDGEESPRSFRASASAITQKPRGRRPRPKRKHCSISAHFYSIKTFHSATMQLRHHGTLLKPAAAARGSPGTTPPSGFATAHRACSVATCYQNDDDIGTAPKRAQVEAEDTYRAAAANMPAGAWASRWERWAPPAAGFQGGLYRPDAADSSAEQLLTSGRCLCLGRTRIQEAAACAAVLTHPPHCDCCRSVRVCVQARC